MYTKLTLTDGGTLIDKTLLDHMQDGIVDADSRLTSVEDRISDALYKPISISTTTITKQTPYGDTMKGGEFSWSLNKSAQQVKVILPGTIYKELDVAATSYNDTESYTITQNTYWSLYVKEADGKTTSNGTTYATDTKYLKAVYVYYQTYWGFGNKDGGFDADFISNLQFNGDTRTPIQSRYYFGGENFGDGVEDQYLYFALPKHLCPSTIYFDTYDEGFKDPFVFETDAEGNQVAVTMTFSGSSLDYNVYRSKNKVTETSPFYVKIGS